MTQCVASGLWGKYFSEYQIHYSIWLFFLLFSGEERGRFKASEIVSDPNRKDCYLATITIADMISSDSRLYFVTIANERGETRYGINVRVMCCYKKLFILEHTYLLM